jgi:hypothetical protein
MITKTNHSEVFNLFVKKMSERTRHGFTKNAGQTSAIFDFIEDFAKIFAKEWGVLTPAEKAVFRTTREPQYRSFINLLSDKATQASIKPGLESLKGVDGSSTEVVEKLNQLASSKYGFRSAGDAIGEYIELQNIMKSDVGNIPSVLTSDKAEKIERAYRFIADSELSRIIKTEADSAAGVPAPSATPPTPSVAPPTRTVAEPGADAAQTTAKADAEAEAQAAARQKEIEDLKPKAQETGADGKPTPDALQAKSRIEKLREEAKEAELLRQIKQDRELARSDLSKAFRELFTIKSIGAIFSTTLFLGSIGAIYYYFSSATQSKRERVSSYLVQSQGCLDSIDTIPGTKAESLKMALSSDLQKINQMSSMTSGSVTEEFVRSYGELIDKVGGTGSGSIFEFANHLQANPDEINGGFSATVSEAFSCIVTNFNAAKSIIMNLAAEAVERGGRSGGGQPYSDGSGTSSGNAISGTVTLSDGSTHTVDITTKKPSIPPKFILFFQDGKNPFFSSPTFTAFVDPDGSGLVPNAVGKPLNGNGRIAAAIKYCYNNGIKNEGDLKRDIIKSINSGLSPLKKLFKNEPEQKAFEKLIKKYKGGGGSSSESLSDDGLSMNKSSDYQNNFSDSINKKSSTMNKLALSKDKITYHEDAVKDLKDKLTKSYYAGLDSMYSEKPKARKTDLKDLYGFQEETGYDLLLEAHPKSTYLAEAMGDGGLVENGLEQKVKSEAVALSTPSGNFRSKYAETHAYLNKLLKVAEAQNKTEVSDLIKQTINQFFN